MPPSIKNIVLPLSEEWVAGKSDTFAHGILPLTDFLLFSAKPNFVLTTDNQKMQILQSTTFQIFLAYYD